VIDPKATTAKTYLNMASNAGIIADQVTPRGEDQGYKEARFVVVTYLRMAASKLREIAEHKAVQEKQP
jgi:hypothetical protein